MVHMIPNPVIPAEQHVGIVSSLSVSCFGKKHPASQTSLIACLYNLCFVHFNSLEEPASATCTGCASEH